MIIAAVPAVLGAAKSVSLNKVTDAVAGIFGDTKAERARDARIESLRVRALSGDSAAVVALGYEAYEQRRGLPGDLRTPVDGKRSPADARADAQRALKAYVQRFGALPSAAAQWAEAVNAPVANPPATPGDAIRGAIVEGVAQGTERAAAEKIDTLSASALNRVAPWLIGVGALAGVYFIWRAFK